MEGCHYQEGADMLHEVDRAVEYAGMFGLPALRGNWRSLFGEMANLLVDSHKCGKSPCLLGKLTISMAIFHSYVT